jgi:protein SCO1/2
MKWAVGPLMAVALSGCGAAPPELPYFTDSTLTPRWLDAAAAHSAHRVTDFALIDQDGRAVQGHDLDGRVRIVSFVYTRCGGICPTTMANLKRARTALADRADVLLLSFSVDPESDDVARIAAYARGLELDARRWKLLTGDVDEIYGLARGSFFAESSLGAGRGPRDFLHTENVYLVDAAGRLRGVYSGTLPLDMNRLVEDVRRLPSRLGS